MYVLYVDESGDVGRMPGSSNVFCLSGLVVHELAWHNVLNATIAFRQHLRGTYGLKLREEIHASDFLYHPGDLARIRKDMRLRILRDVLDFQAGLSQISILNIVIRKAGKAINYDVFETAWMYLIQRFENTIQHRNFPGPQNPQDLGMIFVDKTDEKKLRGLARRLRRYNPVPHMGRPGHRMMPLTTIIEDPVHKDSVHSYLIQLADVNAYFLHQKFVTNKYVRKKGARNWFDRLGSSLCRVASRTHPQGIVIY